MTIRVLHIWGPDYQFSFGGQYIFWKFAYHNWSNNNIHHKLLEYERDSIVNIQSLKAATPIKEIIRSGRFWWAIKLIGSLSRYRNEYDVLHVHMLLWGGLLCAPLAKILGKPAIYESVLEGADNPSFIQKQKLGAIILWCLRRFTKVVAISKSLAEDYRKFNIPVILIPNSVDAATFSPVKNGDEKKSLRRNLGIPENAKILLFVGSVKYRKGVDILVNLFVKLAEIHQDLFLVIVGPNSTKENKTLDMHFIQSLHSQIEAHGLFDRVRFTGMVEDKNILANYYKASDVFVFPTRQEGLGNVVLEASASQLPIVVTHLPEIEDIIQDKVTGFFVPKEDIQGFEEKIALLLDDSEVAARLSKNARRFVENNFIFEKWQSSLTECYKSLLIKTKD